jgi:hypothetical protein
MLLTKISIEISNFYIEAHKQMEVAMAAKFEVYKDAKGEFRFRLKAANGEVIAVGEGYSSKTACLNGIESVKKNAPNAEVVEVES